MLTRTKLRSALAVALVASLAVFAAACGDDDDNGDSNDPGGAGTPIRAGGSPQTAPTTIATQAAQPTSASGTTILIAENATIGEILTDAEGMTLYTFSNDTAGSGTSACTGGCANAWPPLTVDGTPTKPAAASGEIATITRDDGKTQVTYKGLPLYFFANDTAAGQTNGHMLNNVWFAAKP